MKIAKFLEHIHKHTLLARVSQEWHKHRTKRRTAWWESQKGNRDYFDAQLEKGVRMRFHLDSKLAQFVYCDPYEPTERAFLKTFLRTGDVFVDVGANFGLYSLIAARYVGPSGKIYAFEPTQRIFQRLCGNVNLNRFNHVYCFQLAFSDKPGDFEFYVAENGYDAWNSFAKPIAGHSFIKEIIHSETWDHFASQHELVGKIAMMKVDVEGWETRFLSGAVASLSRDDAPLLQMEFTGEAAQAAGSSCGELYRALEKLGYRMYTFNAKSRELCPDPIRDNYVYLNLVATKEPERAMDRLKGKLF